MTGAQSEGYTTCSFGCPEEGGGRRAATIVAEIVLMLYCCQKLAKSDKCEDVELSLMWLLL